MSNKNTNAFRITFPMFVCDEKTYTKSGTTDQLGARGTRGHLLSIVVSYVG